MNLLGSLCLVYGLAFGAENLTLDDRALVPYLRRAKPDLNGIAVMKRLAVNDRLDLVVALGGHHAQAQTDGYWWSADDRLGIFLQDRFERGRIFQIALEPGPNNDCAARLERLTAQEL